MRLADLDRDYESEAREWGALERKAHDLAATLARLAAECEAELADMAHDRER